MQEDRSLPRMSVVAYLKVTETNSNREMGRVLDISTEGMRVQGHEPIAVNTTYHFKMAVPKEEELIGNLQFDANVIWCQHANTPGLFDAGIHLLNISPADSEYLQHIVENIPFENQHLEINRPRPMEH